MATWIYDGLGTLLLVVVFIAVFSFFLRLVNLGYGAVCGPGTRLVVEPGGTGRPLCSLQRPG